MSLRLFVSSTSGSMKIKEQQAYIKRILDSLGLEYKEIDISDPKNAEAKTEMQEAAKSHSKSVVPPHLLRDTNYIGDAQDFYEAVEDDNIEVYLQVPGAKEKKMIAAAPEEKGGNDVLDTEKSEKIEDHEEKDDNQETTEPADKNKESVDPDKESDEKEASTEEDKEKDAEVKVEEAEANKDKESSDKDKDSEEKDKDSEDKDKDSEEDKKTGEEEKETDEKDKESKEEAEEEPKAGESAEPDDEEKAEDKKGESKADED